MSNNISCVRRWEFHFQNALCIDGKYASCAIDSLVEPFFYGIFKRDSNVKELSGGLLSPLVQLCQKRSLYGFTSPEMREPLWDYCVAELNDAFAPKGRFDAEIAEAYRHLGDFSGKNLFCTRLSGRLDCNECKSHVTHQHNLNSLLTLSFTSHEKGSSGHLQDTVEAQLKEVERQIFRKQLCQSCHNRMSGSNISIILPDFFILELPVVNGKNVTFPPMIIPENMDILTSTYELTGAVMLQPGHFWSVVKYDDKMWLLLDDLSIDIGKFGCFSAAAAKNTLIDRPYHVAETEANNAVHIVVFQRIAKIPGHNIPCPSHVNKNPSVPNMPNEIYIHVGLDVLHSNTPDQSLNKTTEPEIKPVTSVDKTVPKDTKTSKLLKPDTRDNTQFHLPSDGSECSYITHNGKVFLLLKDAIFCGGFQQHVRKEGYKLMESFIKRHGVDPKLAFLWNDNQTRRLYISFNSFFILLENKFCGINNEIRKKDFVEVLDSCFAVNSSGDAKLSKRHQTKIALIRLCKDVFDGNKENMIKSISSLVIKGTSRRPFTESGCLTVDDIKQLMQAKLKDEQRSTVLNSIVKHSRSDSLDPMLDPSSFIYMQENFSGFRLGLQLRKCLGVLVPSRSKVDGYSKFMQNKFREILKPKRTFSGWSIDAAQLIKILRYRYHCISPDSPLAVKIYGDGRQIGGRPTAFFALSILNNELYFSEHKYQSSDEIFPIAMFYESDKTDNLMANGKDVLKKMMSDCSGKGFKFYVSGDYNFLMALLDETMNATSNERWNIYHKSHKDSRGDLSSTGLRTDLNLKITNEFPDAVIHGINTECYVLCIMHGFVRQVEKLLDLEICNIFSSGNKAEQIGTSKSAFIEEAIAALETNINRRGVRSGNFEINFDNAGQPKPVKLNGTHAHVIMSPPPDGYSEKEFPHPLRNVLCEQKRIPLTLPEDILKKLRLEKELSEFEIVKHIWHHLFEMQQILTNDPTPRLKLGKEDSHNPKDYEWSYTNAEISLYKQHAETFYQLFRMRYGWKKLTPYMMLYIDHVPQLMQSLPFSLARFMTQGGENVNYRDNSYFYNHTTRHGGKKDSVLQDPIYATLFHRFKNLCHDISLYSKSNDSDISRIGENFENFLNGVSVDSENNFSSGRIDQVFNNPTNIFYDKKFVLVGNIKQGKLKKCISDHGGKVVDNLPKAIYTKNFIIITSQAALNKNPSKQIRIAVRKCLPILSVDYVYNSVQANEEQNVNDYRLNLSNVLSVVRSKHISLKEKHFSGKCSMLSLLKKSQRKIQKHQAIRSGLKHVKHYKNPATYYAMTRRKYLEQRVKSFAESRAWTKQLMAEWKKLTPRRKTKSTLDWTQHSQNRQIKRRTNYTYPRQLTF